MTETTMIDAADAGTPTADVLDQARQRTTIRGLPRPAGQPAGGYYQVMRRPPARVYLYWRWRDGTRLRGKCLGRIDN